MLIVSNRVVPLYVLTIFEEHSLVLMNYGIRTFMPGDGLFVYLGYKFARIIFALEIDQL